LKPKTKNHVSKWDGPTILQLNHRKWVAKKGFKDDRPNTSHMGHNKHRQYEKLEKTGFLWVSRGLFDTM